MPTLPPTPSGVIRFTHNVAGIIFRWEIGYTGTTPNTAVLATLAGDARAAYSAHLAALCSNQYSMVQTEAFDLSQPTLPQGIDSTSVAGTRTGTNSPLNVTALLNFGINRRYRGSKPKVWLPFGTDSDIGSNVAWTTGFTGAVNSGWAAYVGALSGVSVSGTILGSQQTVSYFSGKVANPNPNGRLRFVPAVRATPAVFTVTSATCRQIFGSQRRRL